MSKKIIVMAALVASGIFFTTGCYKVTTVVIPNNGEVVTRTVSLSNDIIPILNSKCSVSGCHSSGGLKPDLSASNAFSSLTNGGYVNTGAPESSDVYLWLTGKKAVAMPIGGPSNPSNLNQLVLAWIKQGAQNN